MPEAADSNIDNASAYETCRFSISVYVTVSFAFADHSRGPVGWLPGKCSCRSPILEEGHQPGVEEKVTGGSSLTGSFQ
jgi:hypothetical protein